MFLDGRHGARCTSVLSGAGKDSPGLGDGVDAAFGVPGGAERRPIVEVSAPIPFAIPAFSFQRCFKRTDVQSPRFGTLVFTACIGKPGEFPEYGVEKTSEPDALAFSSRSDPIHAIVPVSRAD